MLVTSVASLPVSEVASSPAGSENALAYVPGLIGLEGFFDLADANDVRTYDDSAGVLRTVASATEIRDNHHEFDGVSWKPVGLLGEGTDVDYPLRNNTMQGAVAGSPGIIPDFWTLDVAGTTPTIGGLTTIKGKEVIDVNFSGIPTSDPSISFEMKDQIVTVPGDPQTEFVYLALGAGGDLTNIASIKLLIQENTAVPTFVANNFGPDIKDLLTSELQRFDFSAVMIATTARVTPFVVIERVGAVPINLTLTIGIPNITKTAKPVSDVKTFGAAVLRTKETITFPKAFNGYDPTKGRWVANYRPQSDGTMQANRGYLLDGIDTGLNRLNVRMQDSTSQEQASLTVSNGVIGVTVAAGIRQTPDVDNIMEAIYDADSAQMILNGRAGTPSATGYVDGKNFTVFEIFKDVPHATMKSLAYRP